MTLVKRILAAGFQGFYRNKTISIASIFILVVTLSMIANLFLLEAVFKYSVTEIKKKVSITIYLKSDITDISILNIKQKLKNIEKVKDVTYITKDATLANFRETYKGDLATIASLDEISSNPFGASFSVVAKDTQNYEEIITYINDAKLLGEDFASIDKVNYVDIKESINKLNSIIKAVESFGIFVIVVFVAMSIMIIYNTVRLAIFTYREEISIMKLVGASNMYIRGPFIVESSIYGVAASLLSVIIMYPVVSWLRDKTLTFFVGFDMLQYYRDNIIQIFVILCVSGILVSIVSSMLAVRKYLNV